MKRLFLSAIILTAAIAQARDAASLIAEEPGRSGGIYYAYPVTHDVMPPIPDGYEVSFISHYGRHGSR